MTQLAYILAGEPSGDKIAAALMRACKGTTEFHGIGGPLMKAEGLGGDRDYTALQIMGLAEALHNYRALKQLMQQLVDEACALRPDVIYTIDAKAFSLRFAKALRARMKQEGWQAKLVHVVAPTIWAYGAGRRHAFENSFDALLCLFPMEMGLFDKDKLTTKFIGHPAAYQMAHPDREMPRENKRLLLLPGSRASEITSLLPIFLRTISKIQGDRALCVSLVTIERQRALVEKLVAASGVDIAVITGQDALNQAFQTHDLMLAASGTVTLEAALAGMPGLVAYKLNPLVAGLMRMRFKQKDPVLPNIILQKEIYPFFFQSQVNEQTLSEQIATMLDDGDLLAKMTANARELKECLTNSAPSFEDAIASALNKINKA